MDPRTQRLLEGPIGPTLLRLAWPNIIVTVVQASIGLIETYFVAKLGTDALAGMALVFPVVMLIQMMSAGGMGGSSSRREIDMASISLRDYCGNTDSYPSARHLGPFLGQRWTR